MILANLFTQFVFFSFLGWVWETIYCTINTKHFQNRGFLFGPVCPIYGSSVVIAEVVFSLLAKHMKGDTPIWQIFLICMVGSAIMEYLTSYHLEKRFHARWWDYSDLPLNLNGRICLPCSIGFGVAGIVVVKFLLPMTQNVSAAISPILIELSGMLLMGCMGADLALTEENLHSLVEKMNSIQESNIEKAEERVQLAFGAVNEVSERIRDTEEQIKTAVENAKERTVNKGEELIAAVSNAKDITASKEEQLKSAFVTKAKSLNSGEKHILSNMKAYAKEKKMAGIPVRERMRSAMESLSVKPVVKKLTTREENNSDKQ